MSDDIFQVEPPHFPYGRTPNQLLYHSGISLSAKGLFGYMEAKPPRWSFSARRIATEIKESEKTIKKLLNELIEHGYVERKKKANGRAIYQMYFEPKCKNGTVAILHGDNSTPISNKESNKETEKEKKNNKSFSNENVYPLFYSCKNHLICGYPYITAFIEIHDECRMAKDFHRPQKDGTVKEYEKLIGAIAAYEGLTHLGIMEYMENFMKTRLVGANDYHFMRFGRWLFAEIAGDDYRVFNCDGDSQTSEELIELLNLMKM